jgi:hypothetical protein
MPAIQAITAITCNALNHSYIVDVSLIREGLARHPQRWNILAGISAAKRSDISLNEDISASRSFLKQ